MVTGGSPAVWALGALLLLYAAARLWWAAWGRPKSIERELRRQGIPGTQYGLFNTDLRDEAAAIAAALSRPIPLGHRVPQRAYPFIQHLTQKYGKMGFSWKWATPRLMVRDPELVKDIFCVKDGHIRKPPLNPFINLLTMGVAALEGERWVKRRKLIMSAFHIDKLKGMSPAFLTSCGQLIERWEEQLAAAAAAAKGSSLELDVWPEFQSLTGDIISRTAFGSCYEEGKRVFKLQEELFFLALEACNSLYVPGISWYIPTRRNRRIMHLNDEIKSTLREQIRRKEAAMDQKGAAPSTSGEEEDLLGLLLLAVRHGGGDITIEDVIEECRLFYFAGHETTAVTLTWAVVVLSMHPDWQHKAREEVLQVFGTNPPAHHVVQNLNHLKIVTLVLNEVQRLYPPVGALYRHVNERVKLQGGITIPAGVDVVAPVSYIHHDPEIWGEDADEFNPERFSQGISKAAAAGKKERNNAFFPFGWGPRGCLGQNFAMMEAKIALSMILQRFSFELSPSYAHAPYTGVTLQPQYGAQIIFRRL